MQQNPSYEDDDLLLQVRQRAVTRRAWEALYKRFKKLESEGLTQAEFARRIDKAPAQVSRVLSRPRNMTFESYAEYAHGLGVYVAVELAEPTRGNATQPPRVELVQPTSAPTDARAWATGSPVLTVTRTLEGVS